MSSYVTTEYELLEEQVLLKKLEEQAIVPFLTA